MNINPIDFNYVDGTNSYPIVEYIDDNISITSNILNTKIDYNSNIINNLINYNSNIINNLIIYSSNNNNNYTDILRTDISKFIEQKQENIILPIPATLTHTYIYNSNLAGEIRFYTASASAFPPLIPGVPSTHRTKIDIDGKLKIYYSYNPLISLTYGNGFVDIVDSIVGLNSADVNINATIILLQAQVVNNYNVLQAEIDQLILALSAENILTDNESEAIQFSIEQARQLTLSDNTLSQIYTNIKNFYNTGRTVFLDRAYQSIVSIISENAATAFYLGAGGVVFGLIISAAINLSYAETTLSQIKNSITSNTNISSNLKVQLLSSNQDEVIKTYINYASNLYDITYHQGFINSNIKTQQFINDLHVNNLDVNNGNITNINGVNANEIIASGKIKEYNVSLDNIYLTSNHLYNLGYSYTLERQYPPKIYNTYSVQDTVQLLGKSVYHQIITLNNIGISYGSGIYEIYSSSTYYSYTTKDALFNYNLNDASVPEWNMNLYTSGIYNADNSIDGSYKGDWVIIKMPQKIMLTKYGIYQDSYNPLKAPAEWRVYGSTDGVNFIEIVEARQSTRLTSYTSGFYEKTLASTFTTQYQYFGFVFNKLLSTSGLTNLSFSDLKIYGKEITGNTITSNVYCTSNAVTNLTHNDPIICKHTGIYCSVNTAFSINSTTWYKYDLDLRQYTTLGYLQVGASYDPYRIFKISMFYGSLYFDMLTNNEPNICSYEIFMSYKANGINLTTQYQGLNIAVVGYPNNPQLKNLPNTDFGLIRNSAGDINYITIVSKQSALLRLIIEDRVG